MTPSRFLQIVGPTWYHFSIFSISVHSFYLFPPTQTLLGSGRSLSKPSCGWDKSFFFKNMCRLSVFYITIFYVYLFHFFSETTDLIGLKFHMGFRNSKVVLAIVRRWDLNKIVFFICINVWNTASLLVQIFLFLFTCSSAFTGPRVYGYVKS